MSRRVVALAVAWTVAAATVHAQTVYYGVVSDSARAMLAAAWSEDPHQVERGYCVRRARYVAQPEAEGTDSIIRVVEVVAAHADTADPNHVSFACAKGTPELHTHTPATCLTDDARNCTAGGPGAYSCQPSRGDYEKLVARGDPFAVIQCDRRTFRFYYPFEYHVARPSATAGTAKPPR